MEQFPNTSPSLTESREVIFLVVPLLEESVRVDKSHLNVEEHWRES